MITLSALRRPGPSGRTSIHRWRALLVGLVLGSAAGASAFVLGLPGNGTFAAVVWLSAAAAVLAAPGPTTVVAYFVGLAASATVLDVADSAFGLVFLVIGVLAAIAAHGVLCAAIALRVRRVGLWSAATCPVVLTGLAIAVGAAAVMGWIALEFGRGPA